SLASKRFNSSRIYETLYLGAYDLDGEAPGTQPFDLSFKNVAHFSRAFVGAKSLAGNSTFAGTADESLIVDFGNTGPAPKQEHGRVIDVFTNLIRSGSQQLADNFFSLSDYQGHSQIFKDNAFYRNVTGSPEVDLPVYEGIIRADAKNQPISFLGKLPQTQVPDPSKDPSDVIYGTNQKDTLVGGAGSDILVGGAGADKFVFNVNQSFNATLIGVDTIKDFVRGTDTLVLDKTTFTQLTSAAEGALSSSEFATINSANNEAISAGASSAHIVFNSATGDLFYNPDGSNSGLTGGGQFATLTGINTLTNTDFFVRA
ncbi:MAG: calcium-binding protein, partial [Rhizonema sp. PD38]|nr:calcium-binding protein [Rhizonema sp. PD38]